jgi:putative hydrolase of the HAD superfamily
MTFNKIKNIIFDLGGVLIDLDESRTIKCFGQKISTFYENLENSNFTNIAHSFERGEIDDKDFRKKVCEIFNLKLSDEKFDYCWNAIIVGMPKNRIDMLVELRKKYRLFVLSNTNAIHYKFFTKKNYWKPELFEKVYFSHLLHCRKPEKKIYDIVLNENNLVPDETLFIDDNTENIESAKNLNIIAKRLEGDIVCFIKNLLD